MSCFSWQAKSKFVYLRAMAKDKIVVLEDEQIGHIVKRFAHRIVEDHHKEKKIILVGILDNGYELAKRIQGHLEKISSSATELMSIELDKSEPLKTDVNFSGQPSDMKGKVVILVDDVLNSGRTLVHALAEILKYDARVVNTFVLVDRIHRDFPVKADHVGMTLSTTIQERVEVKFGSKEVYAYLK